MATEFRAINNIRHGVKGDDGSQVEIKEFAAGERVTGLSKGDMKALWDAGALEQVEVAGTKTDAPSPESSPSATGSSTTGGAEAPSDKDKGTPPAE
jgi:hypothetical protein